MIVSNQKKKEQLQNFVKTVFGCLNKNNKLPSDRRISNQWKKHWGKTAYSDSITQRRLNLQTQRRKAFLLDLYKISNEIVYKKQINIKESMLLRTRLSKARKKYSSYKNCILLALDAALARQIIKANTRTSNLKIALCYSAFGDVSHVAKYYGTEMRELFGDIFNEIHIYASLGMNKAVPLVPKIPFVNIHTRQISLSELLAFPNIKAPGLFASCHDAVSDDADIIISIDGDARLPLFQVIPAILQMIESEKTDAVLGSRRVAGSVISKPGIRHLSSVFFASYIETVMKPVFGKIRDPQAIFKVFKRKQLKCALQKLGYNKGRLKLNALQPGSLACELLLLSNLTEDGHLPEILEVPAIETMAYPANLEKMLIMQPVNIKNMLKDANKPRINVREYPLIDEGTESLVLQRNNRKIWKMPRGYNKLRQLSQFPNSIVTDNQILQFFMSLSGWMKTIIQESASRVHSERGIFRPVLFDLIKDRRVAVIKCLPSDMRVQLVDNAIRLPFSTSIALKLFWRYDQFILNSGSILRKIGMLPMLEICVIGFIFRFCCLIFRWFKYVLRQIIKILRKLFSFCLSCLSKIKHILKKVLNRIVYLLEMAGLLRIFSWFDYLDQRSCFWHYCIKVPIRIYIEIRLLLESFNISVNLGPVVCFVQPKIRPFWNTLGSLPNTMTDEIQVLLDMALQTYETLGENGYYDGEMSLDNLGFEYDSAVRVVLIDYGALVDIKKTRPDMLKPWLINIKKDYKNSYQAYKLKNYAKSDQKAQKIVEDYIKKNLELIDKWIK